MNTEYPWLHYYGNVPHTIDFPECTMYESILEAVEEFPEKIAYDFMGSQVTYAEFKEQIDRCANALAALGIQKGDRFTVSMPTSPPGIICFYALNKLGAVASMIHPLSTETEIEFYFTLSKSRMALTMDMWLDKVYSAASRAGLEKLLVVKMEDYLPKHLALLYWLKQGRKNPPIPGDDELVVSWKQHVMKSTHPPVEKAHVDPHEMAVILYSGGTTGEPKGIMLSNYNFVSQGLMCAHWVGMNRDYADVLAMLPIFHGFGLGVCVNAALMNGGKSILVPMFEADLAAKMMKKKPNYLIGVPTLYEALAKSEKFAKSDLSCLTACFSGADSLPRATKEGFEKAVADGNGNVVLLEGYGLTEAVTAIMAMPVHEYREGSIGVPFPGMQAKIVAPESKRVLGPGKEGEICVCGPAVMLGYLDQPEETARVLVAHDDGLTWLHTGDIGHMDNDGFFYFTTRQKRMIKSSGMNVYPSQVEAQLRAHPAVESACVIGVPDRVQVERVKAFVVLKNGYHDSQDIEAELIDHCKKDLIKWSCPREIEFRESLPVTQVGKIAYRVLEEEEKQVEVVT